MLLKISFPGNTDQPEPLVWLPLDELIPQQSVLAGVSQHRNICSVLVQRFWFISGLKN